MNRSRRRIGLRASFFAVVLAAWTFGLAAAPTHVYLTWQGDTSKTITVNYQTQENPSEAIVYYDTKPRNGLVKDYRHLAKGISHDIPGLADGRRIHHVELTRLRADTTYYFIAGDAEHGFCEEKMFRTIHDGRDPIVFVTGGDMGTDERARTLMRLAGEQDPMFALIGGDIAYANGKLENIGLWDKWLSDWEELMVASDGRMIPMVLAIGNHEVDGGYGKPMESAPFYFGFFAQEERSYFSRRFGKDVAIYALDTGHIEPQGGEQARWLATEMASDKDLRYRFAVYHVPMYPSHRAYEAENSAASREHWLPIFDEHRLTAGFENHDHTVKRTKRLRANQVDPAGTIYLGDGCFGRAPRTVDAELRWYLEKASSTAHFWKVEATKSGVEYTAIDETGAVVDTFSETTTGVEAEKSLLQRLIFWE